MAVGDIGPATDWSAALQACDRVVHAAAHVHRVRAAGAHEAGQFHRVNTQGTLNLARQAAAAGVARLVFVSSVKAMGEQGRFCAADACLPADAYGVSKREAEIGLLEIAHTSGMEVVIVRPPLVYGACVGANFLQLMQAVDRRLPLPFGSIDNRRSLIYVGNLVAAIAACLDHPAAAQKIYLPKDEEDVSTPDLIRMLATALDRPVRLVRVPRQLLRYAAACLGRSAQFERLTGSLTLDDGAMRDDLGWRPPYSTQQGLLATAQWYRRHGS